MFASNTTITLIKKLMNDILCIIRSLLDRLEIADYTYLIIIICIIMVLPMTGSYRFPPTASSGAEFERTEAPRNLQGQVRSYKTVSVDHINGSKWLYHATALRK